MIYIYRCTLYLFTLFSIYPCNYFWLHFTYLLYYLHSHYISPTYLALKSNFIFEERATSIPLWNLYLSNFEIQFLSLLSQKIVHNFSHPGFYSINYYYLNLLTKEAYLLAWIIHHLTVRTFAMFYLLGNFISQIHYIRMNNYHQICIYNECWYLSISLSITFHYIA